MHHHHGPTGQGRTGNAAGVLRRHAALLLLLPLLAACATRVETTSTAPPTAVSSLPPPRRLLVVDFGIDPDAVRQDQGIGPRLQRQLEGADPDAARGGIASGVQSAIADALVTALARAGLPAQHAASASAAQPGDLIVTGDIQRIDEGNRTRRLGIGFGAGRSVVQAVAQLSAVGPNGPPVLLQTYDGSADSGRKPGMAAGAGMAVAQGSVATGVLSGATNIAGESRRSPVEKEAASLGRRLANQIGGFAAQNGWIAEAAIPPWTR
jgi:hypothetical protein